MSELGRRLKEAREEKGLSLDDLQDMTKIQKRYLRGIEEGNYDIIPGKFYVRAFIRQYVESVGLDPEQIFEEYRSEIPSVYDDDLPEAISRTRARREVSRGTSRFFEILPRIIVIIFIIGGVLLLWYFAQKGIADRAGEQVEEAGSGEQIDVHESGELPDTQPGEEPAEEEDTEEEPIVEEPVQEIRLVSDETHTATYELVNVDEIQLKLTAIEGNASWVRVRDSAGNEIQQTTLNDSNPELVLDVSGEEFIDIRIGNSPVTEIFINDEKLEFSPTNGPKNIHIQVVTGEE